MSQGGTATADWMLPTAAVWAVPVVHGAAILSFYGAAHVIVDTICAAVVFRITVAQSVSPDIFTGLLFLYHAFAFGLQSVCGLIVDVTKTPRVAAILGCMISAAALLPVPPVWAVAVAGVGNAIFHVGGGVICLRVTPQRATAPGLFVAPGSLGLLLGAILGSSGANADAVLATIAAMVCTILAFTPIPCEMAAKQQDKQINRAELILGLILLSIAVRSLLGFLVHLRWDTQPVALLVLTAATVLGKALGGFWADRWGWMRVGIASMLTAMPFLVACPMFPLAAIPGLFLLNITMPITLAATANALPGYPGFAFGLTCLALLIGALPTLLGAAAPGPGIILIVMLISGTSLYGGLRILLRQIWQ